MTTMTRRIALTATAGLIAIGITAGVRASAQNTSQEPRTFSGPPPGARGRGPGGPGGPMGFENPMGILRMLGPRLGLTEAQQTQLKTIADSHREEWKALSDRMMAAHQALREAIVADQLDEALIRSKAAEVGAVQGDVAVASARVKAEAWPVLTPEQQARVKEFQSKAGQRGRRH
jgi:Spy/CpxP family protein refolding chaperone